MRSVFREGTFSGKVAVVTGGGSGIGFRTAYELACLGGIVFLASRSLERLEEAASLINSELKQNHPGSTGTAYAVAMNIRSQESRSQCVTEVLSKAPRIDYLVRFHL